ncbi:N-terminal glutamine amidase-domain-containing protein, partial [Amylocystis lapponica]
WAWDVHVIVISNDGKTVVLWNPKTAGKDSVVWDYHVVLALLPRGRPGALDEGEVSAGSRRAAWVYDFDTRLPLPCRWLGTCPTHIAGMSPEATVARRLLTPRLSSLFRVIPARDFLDYFASDRSHMHSARVRAMIDTHRAARARTNGRPREHRSSRPPPPYPPLCGRMARELGITHNLLDSFVAMSPVGLPEAGAGMQVFGEVMGMRRFLSWVSGDQTWSAE